MATLANLTREEQVGLGIAAAAHVALFVGLMMQPEPSRDYTVPVRMDVSLATDISLAATAPDPSAEPAASAAPEISDTPVPDPAPAVELTEPAPAPRSAPPPPPPRTSERPQRSQTTPPPRPAPQREQAPPAQRQQEATGSRLNDKFLEGMGAGDGTDGSPAREAGPAQRASIVQAINRQLKPKWNPPSGVDVDKLTTVVSWKLNRDGTLDGTPRVVRTTGQNASNSAQVRRHQEQAVRAVITAAPFRLPEEYYSVWQDLEWNFDNRLAQ